MRKVEPYRTLYGLTRALDNGGRFYHLLCRAGDERISPNELRVASGHCTSTVAAYLYLAMASMDVCDESHSQLVDILEPELLSMYSDIEIDHLTPAEAEQQGRDGQVAVVTGNVRRVDGDSPIIGNAGGPLVEPVTGIPHWYYSFPVSRWIQQPVMQAYAAHLLADPKDDDGGTFVIAAPKGKSLDPNATYRFGGVLRELLTDAAGDRSHRMYMRPLYYSRCGTGGAYEYLT